MGPFEREALGKMVRDAWVATVFQLLPGAKPSWLVPWEELGDEFQREVDMRIGETVAAAERERCAQQLEDAAAALDDSETPLLFRGALIHVFRGALIHAAILLRKGEG